MVRNNRKFGDFVVVCLTTICVRISFLENFTPEATIRSISSIWNEVVLPKFIYSDNVTNFTNIKDALKKNYLSI